MFSGVSSWAKLSAVGDPPKTPRISSAYISVVSRWTRACTSSATYLSVICLFAAGAKLRMFLTLRIKNPSGTALDTSYKALQPGERFASNHIHTVGRISRIGVDRTRWLRRRWGWFIQGDTRERLAVVECGSKHRRTARRGCASGPSIFVPTQCSGSRRRSPSVQRDELAVVGDFRCVDGAHLWLTAFLCRG